MPRTNSILDEKTWRHNFGELLKLVAKVQHIDPTMIGQRLDRMSSSERAGRPRGRSSDWWRYANAGRIPTEGQLDQLSDVLRIPRQVLRVCAGYVDDIFEKVYAIESGAIPDGWTFPISPMKGAMALMLSLFPRSGGEAFIGRRADLLAWVRGSIIRPNLTSEEGFLTGESWNAIWLYPVRDLTHLEEHVEDPNDPNVTWIWSDEPATEPWTWYSLHALVQVDLASPVASAILSNKGITIPKNHPLTAAREMLHQKALPLIVRMEQADRAVNHWANNIDKDVAGEIREHLHPWCDRTITDEAARWVRGERIEPPDPSTLPPDTPPPIHMQLYSWDVDGRPHKFWV